MKAEIVVCPYCSTNAEFVSSKAVYNGRDFGMIYLCRPCQAYCGVHKGTAKPFGRLANAELREWRKKTHAVFDPIWEFRIGSKNRKGKVMKKAQAKSVVYKKLAELLEIESVDCHIGMFDIATCKQLVELCMTGKLAFELTNNR